MNWPDDMAQASKVEFSTLLYDFLVSEGSPYSLINRQTPEDLSTTFHLEWLQSEAMLDDICASISENRFNPKFRRGQIEDIVRKHLEIEMKSYDEIKSKGLNARPDKDLKFAIAYYILNLTSTIYQLYHANQFHTVGGLFPEHEDMLIDQGVYSHLVDLKEINVEHKEKRVLFGSLDLSALSIDQIIAFRNEETELFQEYCNQVKKIDFLGVDKFQDTNSEFIDFLVNQYVPAIIQRYPDCGYIENIARGAGDIAAIVTIVCSDHLASIKVAGLALATYVGGVRLSERLITGRFKLSVREIDKFIQKRKIISKFKKNNYQRWDS